MNDQFCFVDGEIKNTKDGCLPLTDLGIQRGYGVFDFFRVKGNKPLFLEDHLERLFHSAKRMRLETALQMDQLIPSILALAELNKLEHSGMRILLTGGDAIDGYSIIQPRLSIVQNSIAPPPDLLPEKGIRLASWNYQRQLSDVKTTDYLMAIWLQDWMKEQKADDILYHDQGSVRECPRSNIFMITEDGLLITPAKGMLAGITRKNILKAASKLNILAEEKEISLDELHDAAGIFISSTTKRMMPVDSLDGKDKQSIAARALMQLIWNELLKMEEAPH